MFVNVFAGFSFPIYETKLCKKDAGFNTDLRRKTRCVSFPDKCSTDYQPYALAGCETPKMKKVMAAI
jgi:hypothetical protein